MSEKSNINKVVNVNDILAITKYAGNIIMGYYKSDMDVVHKLDKSPVTEADIKANDYIVHKLKEIAPKIPVVAEESYKTHNVEHIDIKGYFWLVDPLDGTKGFLKHNDQFTVNIGLIYNKKPVFGVVQIPAKELLYYVGEDGNAYRIKGNNSPEKISAKNPDAAGFDVIVSHSHKDPRTDDFLKKYNIRNSVSSASSIKFCVVAEGGADIYPRFGRTMEWDTAAGHAILNAAGGSVKNVDGSEFLYGKDKFENPDFIAWGKIK